MLHEAARLFTRQASFCVISLEGSMCFLLGQDVLHFKFAVISQNTRHAWQSAVRADFVAASVSG